MPALPVHDPFVLTDVDTDEVVSFRVRDVRARLDSILGCVELIDSGDLDRGHLQLYTTMMLREGRRLTRLIDSALVLQGFESGSRKLDLTPVDLHSLIRRAVAAAGEDEARPLAVQVDGDLPLVSADPEAILGTLIRFVSNARRFSPDGGPITIVARPAGDMVEVHVHDHGIGIDRAALPRLFDKHLRSERELRRLGPGAGFALTLNQWIVEAHGGRVQVSSDGPGQGADFQFTLAVAQSDATDGDVLIVDDEAGFARLIKAALATYGFSSIRGDDAETAERLLAVVTRRAIVIDFALPGLAAGDFLRRIWARGRGHLPVVVLTGRDMAPGEISALEASGVIAVLPKEAGAPQAAAALIARALAPSGAAV